MGEKRGVDSKDLFQREFNVREMLYIEPKQRGFEQF